MRIEVPHNTSRENARRIIDAKISELLGMHGHHAEQAEHSWSGDTMTFKGKARGFALEGTVEVTEQTVILNGKLPLLAKPFEPRIRHTVEQEAASLFPKA
ncbi:MAG TPA: polyhydroxyalkanoic acid system family protein [Thermoanaerobaculia bacterium]|nr:polyhydroxyalkanoic acid system family protein [Thermoanaerobaculia bacterium]